MVAWVCERRFLVICNLELFEVGHTGFVRGMVKIKNVVN